jgi:hypothetical protein
MKRSILTSGIEVTTRKHHKFFRLKRPLISCERLVSDREVIA